MSGDFIRVTRRLPCPICRHTDWCLISRDGKTVLCPRVESAEWKGNKGGGYLHKLDAAAAADFGKKVSLVKTLPTNSVERRDPSILHKIYRAFLSELELSEFHRQMLRMRGFSDAYITRENFKSFPRRCEARAIAARLNRQFNLAGVPGFYQTEQGAWELLTFGNATGYLIPILSAIGDVAALQLRRDDKREPKYLLLSSAKVEHGRKGSASGVPAHFAFPEGQSDQSEFTEIILTEGALKARVIAFHSAMATVGLVSTTCFDESLPSQLRQVFPSLAQVDVAFDMDLVQNPHVLRQFERLSLVLLDAGLEVSLLTWDRRFKGLDDFLTRHFSRTKL